MLKLYPSKSHRWHGRTLAAWTLVEMSVALAIGTLILGSFVTATITVANTMVAIGNYNDLNKTSRNTLDRLSQDVRNASAVSSSTTSTYLCLTNSFSGTYLISYYWDGTNNVTRSVTSNGVSTVSTVLKNCDTFSLSYYQRNPTNNYGFVPTSSTSQIKLVSVSWRCSRKVLGVKLNTESVQTASVVMRN